MKLQTTEARELLHAIIAPMSPTTLAAMINDLDENDQLTEPRQLLAEHVRDTLANELASIVGEDVATQMLHRDLPY